jgi:hypothetical protein
MKHLLGGGTILELKSVGKLKRQLFELGVLQPFFVILLPTTLTSLKN